VDYPSYRSLLATELVITDAPGLALLDATLPQIIAHAEERIFKDSDFDFLATRTIDTSASTRPGQRSVQIPTELVIIEQVSLVTPALKQSNAAGASTIQLLRIGTAAADAFWPNFSQVRAPKPYETYYAIPSQQVVADANNAPPGYFLVVPTVDGEYNLEIRGTFDPTPFSAANPETFLSLYYPSLFFTASMAIATGVLKQNYGAQSDDPQQAISWEAQFAQQKQVAVKRAQRTRSWGPGWVTTGPSPLAVLPRFEMIQQQAQPGQPG
jgi:hypothetical protein